MARGGARPGAGRRPGSKTKATADVILLAQQYGATVIEALAAIATDGAQSAAARVSACNVLLERGFGKAMQAVELTGRDGMPMEHVGMTPSEFEKVARRVAEAV